MPKIPEEQLIAFRDELKKTAAVNPIVGAAATAGTLGALGTGYFGYSRARDQGMGVGDALRQGAKSGLYGAAGGAALGAGLAGVAPGAGKAVSNFGQRQVHSLTGWTPSGFANRSEALHSIGEGAHDARQALQAAEQSHQHVSHAKALADHAAEPPGFFKRLIGRGGPPTAPQGYNPEHFADMSRTQLGRAVEDSGRSLANAQAGHAAAAKAEEMGLTSIPGYISAVRDNMKQHGLVGATGKVLGTGLRAGWDGTTAGQKAMMVGLPTALALPGALQAGTDEAGQGRGERIGGAVGGLVGGVATAPLSMLGGQVLGEGFSRAGRAVGRGVDRLQQWRQPQVSGPPRPENIPGNMSREVEASPRVTGSVEG